MENEQQTNKINPIKSETDNLNIPSAIKEIEFTIYHTKCESIWIAWEQMEKLQLILVDSKFRESNKKIQHNATKKELLRSSLEI